MSHLGILSPSPPSLSSLRIFFPFRRCISISYLLSSHDFIGRFVFIIYHTAFLIIAGRTPATKLGSYRRPRENPRKISKWIIIPRNASCSPVWPVSGTSWPPSLPQCSRCHLRTCHLEDFLDIHVPQTWQSGS